MSRPRPSRTALKIARFMVLLDAQPRLAGVLPPGAALAAEALLTASGAVRPAHVAMMRRPGVIRFARATEVLTGRGQILWFGVRKRFVADAVEAAIAGGARQLLVVGAGFDPLAALVARANPDVTCVEIDAPATAEPKRVGLAGAGLLRDNLCPLSADLARRSLAEVLPSTWRCDLPSVVVAEGLLMYLDLAAVRRFFADIRRITAVGSRVVFTSVTADERGEPRLLLPLDRLMRVMLRLAGEPIRWGVRPDLLPAFLADQGYRLRDQPDEPELRRRYLAPLGAADEPLQPADYLTVAETV
jgi:methyltransferase (TIGR00027 family)